MDLLRWRPYSELLQDGVKDDVVGVIRVCLCYPPPPCRKLGYMQKQMGYSFFVLFFFLESCIYKFFFSSCLFNKVKSSLQSSPSQFVLLFSFLLLLNEVPGVAHRKQTVT